MNLKKVLMFIAFIGFNALSEIPTMAVVELGGDISKSESKVLSDKLASILISTNKYKLVERSMMDEILKEQGFQQTGCTDQNCAVEIGQLLGVQKMCTGSIGKIGSSYSITLRIVNVSTGEIEQNSTYDFKGDIEDVLYKGLPEAVEKLLAVSNKQGGSTLDKEVKQKSVEERMKRKKIFAIASTVITAGTAGAAIYSWIDKKNIHDEYLSVSDQNKLDKYIKDEESVYKRALVFTGIAGALLPTTIVLWTKKIKDKDTKEISITPFIIPGEASLNLTYKF